MTATVVPNSASNAAAIDSTPAPVIPDSTASRVASALSIASALLLCLPM
jgi:hypothetical protein